MKTNLSALTNVRPHSRGPMTSAALKPPIEIPTAGLVLGRGRRAGCWQLPPGFAVAFICDEKPNSFFVR